MKALGQGALVREVVQRRQQFSPCQVAGGAEDTSVVGATGRRSRPAVSGFSGVGSAVG